jgi:hypothetical protein
MSVALIEGLEQATAYAETGYMHDGIIHVPGEEPLWTGRKLYKVDSAGKLRAWFMQRRGITTAWSRASRAAASSRTPGRLRLERQGQGADHARGAGDQGGRRPL